MSYAILGMANAVCVSIEFLAGIPWGPAGVVVSLAVVNYLILHPSPLFAFAGTGIRPLDFYLAISRPVIISHFDRGFTTAVSQFTNSATAIESLFFNSIYFWGAYLSCFFPSPGGKSESSLVISAIRNLSQKPSIAFVNRI